MWFYNKLPKHITDRKFYSMVDHYANDDDVWKSFLLYKSTENDNKKHITDLPDNKFKDHGKQDLIHAVDDALTRNYLRYIMYCHKIIQIWFVMYVVIGSVDGQQVNKSCECGIAGKNRRIVGGTTVQPHQYPWLVSLMLGPKLHCGGAIITDLHILTAGHCITFGVHYHDLSVYVGMHDRLDNSFSIRHVSKGVKHPSFTSNAVRDINDLAVLTLDKRLKFSDKVRPICLSTEDMDFDGLPLTVAGWGKTRQGALTSSRYLLETKVTIVTPEKCRKSSIYKDNLVPETMMCAYSRGKDACQGDSGGPLFSTHRKTRNKKWYQVGIVSWGIDCAMPDYPGVYTVISKYLSWIKQQSRDGVYCV